MPDTKPTSPIEPSWKLLAVSSDMMDDKFCNKRFPFRWRSSLALSAFEPPPEALPENTCRGRVTMLKLTATITGYQPTREETEKGYASFPDVPTEELSRILDQYFACYGAMIDVAVFPNPSQRLVSRRVAVDFDHLDSDDPPSSPLTIGELRLTVSDADAHRVVDLSLEDGRFTALDLFREFAIDCPSTTRVAARVLSRNTAGVTLRAFEGDDLVDSVTTDVGASGAQDLVVEGDRIDRVEFEAPQNEGFLLEFAYEVAETREYTLSEYPHIIDVEPKLRELIQASTESGEILTSSKSNVKTNRGFTNTESSQTGYELSAMVGEKDKYSVAGKLTHTNTETEQENWSVATDASRERQEKEGSSTQVSQLYNLLSSYHLGTNRAQFLMLARPHVLQPTDHRTFVDGLRQIEGVQEFILIVERPYDMAGLCVEAHLETGHFPEGLVAETPPDEFEESSEEFKVTAFADNGWFSGDTTNIETTHDVLGGWVVDTRPHRGHDPGHPGLQEIANDSNSRANSSLENYNYQRVADATVKVSGKISGAALQGDKARFDRTYRVFTRSIEPKPSSAAPKVPLDRLLITSRGLCVCFKSGENCLDVDPRLEMRSPFDDLVIVDERPVAIERKLLTRSASTESRLPATMELVSRIRTALTTSWRRPQRRAPDEAPGFLESDYFASQIARVLPKERLTQPVRTADLPVESSAVQTVEDVLTTDLSALRQKTGLASHQVLELRRALLGLTDEASR